MTISTIILNTYLFALIVVACFSFEAVFLAIVYLRSRRDEEEKTVPENYQPRVTVQLPIYNEMFVAKRLIHAICALDYPQKKLEIQVLDDSTDETREICGREVDFFQKSGFNIRHISREKRSGFKAGALRHGLELATGELIAIFDADFIPPRNFIKNTFPFFNDPAIGMVQTRWDHLNEEFSLLTRAQAFGLAGHFAVEQSGRNAAGYFINFNGTAGIWRKSCIEDAGNWQDDTLTEDLDLSYRAQMRGWKFKFLHDVVTPSELPAEINALKSQQYRWTKGAVETARKILPRLWKSKLPLRLKIHSTLHLTNNFVYPFILILAVLNLPLLFIKRELPESEHYFFIFAFFMISFWASFFFYAVSHKSIYPDWKKRLVMFPVFMSGSMGFAINNTRAVIEGLLRIRTPFIRTPKYRLIGKTGQFVSRYRMSLNKGVIFEILMAIYCSVGVVVSFYYFELGILPFMLMFFLGFGLIGYLSVKHYLKHS